MGVLKGQNQPFPILYSGILRTKGLMIMYKKWMKNNEVPWLGKLYKT